MIHFEIPIDEPERANAFYRDALGWQAAGWGGGQGYWLVTAGGEDEQGANGALISRGEIHRAPVLIAAVDDVDECLARVEQAGGHVVSPRSAVPSMGWAAYFRDTEGNVIGVFQQDPGAA